MRKAMQPALETSAARSRRSSKRRSTTSPTATGNGHERTRDELTTEAGFEIRGRFYPMPEAFRLCDPVLVEELTGMKFAEFAEALDEMGEAAER
jgi:hypothetical protein